MPALDVRQPLPERPFRAGHIENKNVFTMWKFIAY